MKNKLNSYKNKIILFNRLNNLLIIIFSIFSTIIFNYLFFFYLSILNYNFKIVLHISIILSIFFILKNYIFKKIKFSKLNAIYSLDRIYSTPKGIIFTALLIGADKNLYSESIVSNLEQNAVSILSKLKIKNLILNLKLLRINYIALICSLILTTITFNKYDDQFFLWIYKMYIPQNEIFNKYEFIVQPKNLNVIEGDDLKIIIKKIGKQEPTNLKLNYYNTLAKKKSTITLASKDNSNYEFTFFNITNDIVFNLVTENYKSKDYLISVQVKPFIKIDSIFVDYPQYTNKSAEQFNTDKGNVKVIRHSQIEIFGSTNFIISKAYTNLIEKNSFISKPIRVNENKFRWKFTALKNQKYYISCRNDKYKISSAEYSIEVDIDTYPIIEIVEPEKYFKVDEDMIVALNIVASDDFGIDTIGVVYSVDNGSASKINLAFSYNEKIGKYSAAYIWDLEKLNIGSGSQIDYYAFALDNDIFENHKFSKTDTYHIAIPSLTDLFSEDSKKEYANNEILNELNTKQSDLVRETKKVLEDIMRNNKDDWQMQQELKNLYDKQQKIKKNLENIKNGIEKSIENFNSKNMLDYQIAEKISMIKKLFDEIINEDFKKSMENLQRAIDSQKITDKEKSMFQAKFDMDKFAKKLDDTLKLLQKFNLTKKLNIMKNLYNEISEKQNQITRDLIQNQNPETIKNSQDKINRDIENINKMLEELKQENKSFKNELDKINNDDLIEQSKKLFKNINSGEKDKSINGSRKLTKDLKNTGNKLSEILDNEQIKSVKESQKIILKIIKEFLFLVQSFDEFKNSILQLPIEELLTQFKISFLTAVDQYKIAGTKILSLNFDIIKMFYQLNNDIILLEEKLQEKKRINQNLEIENYQKQLLNLVKILLKEKDDMMSRLQKQNQQSGSDDFDKLTQMQSMLNSLTESIDFSSSPEMLKQLAYEQQMLCEMMERLQQKQNQYNNMLGDLSDTVKKMKEVEEKINKYKNANDKKEIIQKQKEIVNRMMQSQKSINKEPEKEEKREAKQAKEYKIDEKFFNEKLKKYEEYLNKQNVFNEFIPQVYLKYIKEFLKNN